MLETVTSSQAAPEAAAGGDAPPHEDAHLAEASLGAAREGETPSPISADGASEAADAPPIEARSAPADANSSAADGGRIDEPTSRAEAPAAGPTREAPPVEPPRATLIPFVAPTSKRSGPGGLGRFATDRRFQTGAAAACLALIAVVAGGATLKEAATAQRDSQRLAQAVHALAARIEAVEAARPRDEAAEIRKAVNEARGGLASSRDLSATVAQLNARLDRLEREQQARLDKLGERIERDAAAHGADAQARAADLAARLDKLEKSDAGARLDKIDKADLVARLDKLEKADLPSRIEKVEKKVATQSVSAQPAVPPLPPQKDAAAASPGVSNEVTGSIDKPHPMEPIRGWYLLEVRNGSALVEGRQGLRQVAPGDLLPGAGKVERFEKRGREWAVVTDQGIIVQGSAGSYAPRVVLRPPVYGPFGGYGPAYGGYED